MTEHPAGERLDPAVLDAALQALLDEHPTAVVFALDSAARRVPVPADERFATCVPLPGEEPTAIDYVVPADRVGVGTCWNRARATGLARGGFRLACAPDQVMTVTFVDCRDRHGVWIGVIVAEGGWTVRAGAVGFDPALLVPSRPRTAEVRKNLLGVITGVDERATRMVGWSAAEMVGRSSLEFVHPDDHERAIGQWLELRARRSTQRVRLRHRHRDGHWLWVEIENVFVGLDDPDDVVAIGRMTDISDEMAAIEAVRQRERLFRRLTESLPVGVLQVDEDARVLYANRRASDLLGTAHDAGATPSDVHERFVGVEPAQRTELERAVERVLEAGVEGSVQVDAWVRRGGDRRRCQFTLTPLTGAEDPPGAIVLVADVTESARLREELQVRATYDGLTGCLNRAAVLAELGRALTAADGRPLAVVFIDLDDFKAVNDSYGHSAGDALLTAVGQRLRGQARAGDSVGRLGGDEFLVLCPGVGDDGRAVALARRIHDHLDGTFRLDGGIRVRSRASVGVTVAQPGDPADASPDAVVARADAAMYRAKRRSRDRTG
ncbi:GGDEF domain-containing protein [Pseudonocardia lacus]|uniref:GGDEF domain-containing protein n=1 Tax=Pseudonocardia lacus TaxID=2835865 RepID=UPI001BDDBBB8|nr:GGDEF domain-containing protein [Pseudonocardia lacus]